MTSIEWLIKELYTEMNLNGDARVLDEILAEAKEMERKQMIDFANNCQEMFKHQIEEKYNKTYGGDK
jgi:hypothetical protein